MCSLLVRQGSPAVPPQKPRKCHVHVMLSLIASAFAHYTPAIAVADLGGFSTVACGTLGLLQIDCGLASCQSNGCVIGSAVTNDALVGLDRGLYQGLSRRRQPTRRCPVDRLLDSIACDIVGRRDALFIPRSNRTHALGGITRKVHDTVECNHLVRSVLVHKSQFPDTRAQRSGVHVALTCRKGIHKGSLEKSHTFITQTIPEGASLQLHGGKVQEARNRMRHKPQSAS
mmetsp:Transcript_32652/g.75120  ORF Transcript_32652/g.75120 Transcript_32652/m.75120 type:complete len:229 (+) Transcript_32652:99-785(+)